MTQLLLEHTPIGQVYTACDLGEDLESFTTKHVSDTIYYERRHGWTNGEESNGFAQCKAMVLEYGGNHWEDVNSSTKEVDARGRTI